MLENCKDLGPNGLTNLFMGSFYSEINHDNRTHMFNFSEEHFAKILEGFWSSRQDRNLSTTAEIALISIYSFLIVVGLITNMLVSFVVARRKQMHTARNLYIVNLTVSDISLCLICMPFTLVMILRKQWTLGPLLCKLVSLLQGTNIMVSVGTITVIALDRYFAICKRNAHRVADTRRNVLISITLIWIISILVAMPLFFYQVSSSFLSNGIPVVRFDSFHQIELVYSYRRLSSQ